MTTAALTFVGQAAGMSDDFESYTAGATIHGQGGWKGWDNSAGAAAMVSTAQALSGTQSVNVSGASDLVHEFGYSGGLWELSLSQYIPASASGTTYLILMNKYKDSGGTADYNWSVQIPINLGAGTAADDMVGGEPALSVTKDQWATWKFSIDLDANRVGTYYNDQLWTEHDWTTDGALSLAAIDLYANNATAVYYDDLKVQQIPEPTTLALLGLGAVALVLRRRSR